ncbi:MAG: FxsA family protein [Pseudomonadota bacterium]
MRLLFLLFIVLPIAELLLLFKVGQTIGALQTIAIVVFAAFVGSRILKRQSFSTLRRAQDRWQHGEVPGREIIEGFFLSVGGALLLTPGFITDVFAIALLLPWTRRALANRLLKAGTLQSFGSSGAGFRFMHMGTGQSTRPGTQTNNSGNHSTNHDVFEGEFTRENPGDRKLSGPDQDKAP